MTNLEENIQKDRDVLLMLSGGRDSFLSACRLIEDGYRVHMITYDNGCLSNLADVGKVADRVIRKYGSSVALFVGIQSVSTSLYRLQESYLYTTIDESSKKYPKIRPAQLPCLVCHTGMYLESIVYCRIHKIAHIAEGARESQKFFVELPEMVERYKKLTEQNGIELILPVYDLKEDWERKLELADRGYVPKTSEPQCWLGSPLRGELSLDEIRSLAAYYDEEIEGKLQKIIEKRVKECLYEEMQEEYRERYTEF